MNRESILFWITLGFCLFTVLANKLLFVLKLELVHIVDDIVILFFKIQKYT